MQNTNEWAIRGIQPLVLIIPSHCDGTYASNMPFFIQKGYNRLIVQRSWFAPMDTRSSLMSATATEPAARFLKEGMPLHCIIKGFIQRVKPLLEE
jgi:hypothetical protein